MVSDKQKNKREEKIIELARQAVEGYTKHGRQIDPPAELEEELSERNGVFVSLKKDGQLRGCIGTVEPSQQNLAREIVKNAVSACGHDPRFPALRPDELPELNISVDVLGEKEAVASFADLDPKKYGVIVKKGHKSGLLLPDLEGVDTVEKQLSIACKKAGIMPPADGEFGPEYDIYRFEVERYD